MNGATGCEDEIKAFIIKEISPYCDKLFTDKFGNLIAFKKGEKTLHRPLMFDAHMDEVGFMVRAIDDEGYIKFVPVGGIDAGILPAKRVKIGKNNINGVISSKPVHMQRNDANKNDALSIDKLLIDIGAKDREDALSHVSIGDYIHFDSKTEFFGENGGVIKAKALDDRLGCYLLINAMRETTALEYDTYFCFSVQEETGLRGAAVAAHNLCPSVAVALDATTAGDMPGVSGMDVVCRQGEGGVLSLIDGAAIYDKELLFTVMDEAKARGIKHQLKTRPSGGNDAAALQRAGYGARVCAMSAPSRYIHSPSSTVRVEDVDSMQAMIGVMIHVCGKFAENE